MNTLVVVPCGIYKIWKKYSNAGPTPAKNVYKGAPFKVYKEYAETFSDQWVILSAKYGFINPDFIIPEDYNVSFTNPSTNPISLKELIIQVNTRLNKFNCVIALGGKTYTEITRKAFEETGIPIKTPTIGLTIDFAMGKVKKATREGRPLDC
ncbi:MAG: DUF6884 domain-containing protein [Candidatus Heimdallarchaeota archaeon]